MDRKILMLYSGGADSVVMMNFALSLRLKPYCILFDYGQKHIQELEYAKDQLSKFSQKIGEEIEYRIVSLKDLNFNSGLTGNFQEGLYTNVHPMNVPARNTIFISIAYGIAESNGIKEIWIGCDYSDFENRFPDCTQQYIGAMNEVLKIAPSFPIRLVAPLLGWTKDMVLKYIENNIDLFSMKDIYSGYSPPK